LTQSGTAPAPRRNNAPIRQRKPATSMPDLLFALALAGWTMAVVFFVASFLNDTVTSNEAGKELARLFAGALSITSLFAFLLGIVLVRDERNQADHYLTPFAIGIAIGALESMIFLVPADTFLLAPFLLLIFVFRPIRRRISTSLRNARGSRG
jgi:hypothetical protein